MKHKYLAADSASAYLYRRHGRTLYQQKENQKTVILSKGGPESGLPLKYKNSQKGTEKYDENNGKETGSKKEPGENFKKNDGLSEKSRADGQQEKNEPSHDQKGVKAYDEQKRIL